ncbi:MAG: metalloregulator ArsR/SmtB family transcription factor [Clostridiales Family XIII bacterium]|jgi:ArsR family transcriptional regulator|nr:metalloregulator ArsR/SmtB family transcription factor [Clostridiales Family XIII bacterium]
MEEKKVKAARTKRETAAVDAPVCECGTVHEDAVAAVRGGLSADAALLNAAELFKVFGDPTRLKIVNALLLGELCVCDVAAVLGMSQPAVSHHLKVLKAARLVKYRREGKQIFYSLDDEHVTNIFYQGLLHTSHA